VLNVWRAQGTNERSNLPVLFWIHGGAFTNGAGGALEDAVNPYDGANLATQGVLVVSINYRLGAMGFARVEEGIGGGTGRLNGIQDQVVALQWARDNVASFGGDPSQITVFGESAGSLSICMLIVSPLAAGLFNQAIMESGACTHGSYWGVKDSSDDDVEHPRLADLRAMTPQAIFDSVSAGPSIDGYVVPKHPLEIMDEGGLNVDSVLLGGNSFDGLTPWFPEEMLPNSQGSFDEIMFALLGANGFSWSGAQALLDQYSPERYLTDPETGDPYYRAAMTQCDGDLAVVCP